MDLFETTKLIDSLPLSIVLIDQDERIVAMNSQANALFESTQIGRHYLSVLRQPDAARVIENCLVTSQATDGTFEMGETGKTTRYQITCTPSVNHANQPRVIVSIQDISDQYSAGQMRRDFVANVSHELRTPLTALLGFIETLRGPAKNDAQARDRFLSIMEREASRMNRLIRDLLSLSQIEAQERQRPKQVVDLNKAVQASYDMLTSVAEAQNVTLKLSTFSPEIPVRGDSDQLQQMFTNLVENAIKYGRDNGIVTITIHSPKHDPRLRGLGYKVEVADQGDGINEQHIARLMERFYRVDDHRSREMGGTGLGLAIVKHIVNRHRGHIRIQSTQGVGSTFTIWLPAETA